MRIKPHYGSGVNVSASQTSASSAITVGNATSMIVTNNGSSEVFVLTGQGSAPTADTADMIVMGGERIVLDISPETTHVAAICNSGETTSVNFIPAIVV